MDTPATAALPLFPVSANINGRSVEENVELLKPLCHVCEVQAPFALVHASAYGVARISTELGLEVYHSKQGGEYYAVRVRARAQVAEPVAPIHGVNCGIHGGGYCNCDLKAPVVVPPAPASAPRVRPSAPSGGADIGRVTTLTIKGQQYRLTETACKRRVDVRRWEARKLGDEISTPYVVTFQDAQGSATACSCPDAIYRKNFCKHQAAAVEAFGGAQAGFVQATG